MTNDELRAQLMRIRMDLTNAQGKLTDAMQALDGANIQFTEPLPAVEQIRRQIRNGVIRDPLDLAAEVRAHRLEPGDAAGLFGLLSVTGLPSQDELDEVDAMLATAPVVALTDVDLRGAQGEARAPHPNPGKETAA